MNRLNNYKNLYRYVSKINNIKTSHSFSHFCTNKTNFNNNINNINNINENRIKFLNKRYSTTISTNNNNNNNHNNNNNNKSIYEIIGVYNNFIDSFDNFSKNKQPVTIQSLLNEIYNIQQLIIKRGSNEIKQFNCDERLLLGGLFWELDKIYSHLLKNYNNDKSLQQSKINWDDVNNIYSIMDIENELIKSPDTIFNIIKSQISSVIHNNEFRSIGSKSIQRLVKEFKLLSNESVNEIIKQNLEIIKLYTKIATNMGLWQEMIYLKQLINSKNKNNSQQVLTGITGGAGQYDLDFSDNDMDVIYDIVTRNPSISTFLPNDFIDINSYQPLKDDSLTSAYDLKSLGKKSLVMVKIDNKGNTFSTESPSKLLKLNENKFNKESGYYNDEIANITSMIILGRSIKLVVDVGLIKNLVHIGITNQDQSKCLLVGSIKNSLGDFSVSVLNLDISSNKINNSLQLEGTQTLSVAYSDGESLLYTLKTKLNFEKNTTNNLF